MNENVNNDQINETDALTPEAQEAIHQKSMEKVAELAEKQGMNVSVDEKGDMKITDPALDKARDEANALITSLKAFTKEDADRLSVIVGDYILLFGDRVAKELSERFKTYLATEDTLNEEEKAKYFSIGDYLEKAEDGKEAIDAVKAFNEQVVPVIQLLGGDLLQEKFGISSSASLMDRDVYEELLKNEHLVNFMETFAQNQAYLIELRTSTALHLSQVLSWSQLPDEEFSQRARMFNTQADDHLTEAVSGIYMGQVVNASITFLKTIKLHQKEGRTDLEFLNKVYSNTLYHIKKLKEYHQFYLRLFLDSGLEDMGSRIQKIDTIYLVSKDTLNSIGHSFDLEEGEPTESFKQSIDKMMILPQESETKDAKENDVQ